MCKAQGQTLTKALLWFDIDEIPPGTGYVAMSRVQKLVDVYFVTPLKKISSNPSIAMLKLKRPLLTIWSDTLPMKKSLNNTH